MQASKDKFSAFMAAVADNEHSEAVMAALPVRQRLYWSLRSAILDARLQPGAAVYENELAERYGVSRTPVREAMQRLVAEGLVQVVPQVGSFVVPLQLERMREALFVRERVECGAIERIARPLTEDETEQLKTILATHRAAVAAADLPAILRSDEAFHRGILDIADLSGVWRYVQEAREMHRRARILTQPDFGSAHLSVDQHAAILNALQHGLFSEASRLMGEHITMNLRFVEALAVRRPEFFTPVGSLSNPKAFTETF